MRKKLAFMLGILLFSSFFFFLIKAQDSDSGRTSLEAGTFSDQVRQAQSLQRTLSGTLNPREVRLCFRGEELACDRKQNLWYLPVNMDEEAWEAGRFTDADPGTKILPLQDYTVLNKKTAVSQGTPIPFLAWKESEGRFAEIRVVFTGLPVIRMETDADLDIDTVFAGSIVFYESCGKERWTLASVFRANERGQTTRAYPKKGYRVNLITVTQTGVMNKNTKPVFGMRDSDSWIFYAIYSDGTKIRDKFNTELWNQFGAGNTPYDAHFGTHMQYAELVVNGEYRGLYGIMEPVDSDQLEMSDQEYLYKRTFGRELLPELLDETGPEDYLTTLGMEVKGRDGAGSKADWECFRSYMELLKADDETFRRGMQQLLNMDNMVDIWLYVQFLYGEDNIYKNMFFAFKREDGSYRLYLVPWDTDLSWGNVYIDSKEDLYVAWAPQKADAYLKWPFADRLMELDAGNIRERVCTRWKELRKTVFSEENLKELMEECRHQIMDSGVLGREAARWPDSRYDINFDGMREFMDERAQFLDILLGEEKIKEKGWEDGARG